VSDEEWDSSMRMGGPDADADADADADVCSKRHLAHEETAKRDTESKSYRSLKNWGHDAQKTA
jgi:hypothetical protein